MVSCRLGETGKEAALGWNFGRKKDPDAPNKSEPGGMPPHSTAEPAGFPWKGLPEAGACNLALGDIINNFPTALHTEGRQVHAETMLSGLGGVAGFASQMALRSMIKSGERTTEGLQTLTLKDGRQFVVGDPLNNILAKADPAIHSLGLWPLAAGAALQAGLAEKSLPELAEQFEAVIERLGTPDEGFPKLAAAHRPAFATAELMKRSWPFAKMMLTQAYPEKPGPLGPVPPSLWPAVTAHASANLLRKTAAVLDIRVGLEILMQSAIYGSKLDASLFQ
jgi:hypothetical protein